MAGVYIHIPFCKQLCAYCDFYFSVSLVRKNDMLQALLKEMELRHKERTIVFEHNKKNNYPATLYFGGGTPSIYLPDELKILADKAIELYMPNGVMEFTIEVNPDDLTEEYLCGLKNIGVNRLSIGIQSFIDRDLQWMRRRHNAQQAIDAVRMAQQAGFSNITIDLIYGIPNMTMDEWEHNIRQALVLNVPHLSAYHLTIEPQTILGKQLQHGKFAPIDDELSAAQYELLEKLTTEFGYFHYEISNFAKPDYYSKHNSLYWQQQPYVGVGPSAHSYNGKDLRRWNVANNKKYIDALLVNSGDNYFEEERLSIYDRYNEYVLTLLRTSWGINLFDIKQLFGEELHNYFLQQATPFHKSGKLTCEDGVVTIPSIFFLISDSIISPLFWA